MRPAGLAVRREAIQRAIALDEDVAVRALKADIDLAPGRRRQVMEQARELVQGCRRRSGERPLLDSFLAEFGLSSEEGIALMCLAEALLRVPDADTADALVADRLAAGNWAEHAGASESLFVNASTWALLLTGRALQVSERIAKDAHGWLLGLAARLGDGVVRAGVSRAMRILGREFILGADIDAALANARGAVCSFDMLGEGARSQAAAERHLAAYEHALAAVARAQHPEATPATAAGISVKLSALHPRFETAQREAVLAELVPRALRLARQAAAANVHLTVDAEETARLGVTLDVVERMAEADGYAGWGGLGLAVQAYAKSAPAIIDWLAALAHATNRRLMVRLVKGAYWDTEIKRAQVGGHDDYPVFTRKAATDLSYLACATRLLRHEGVLLPMFATHNAHTLASVAALAEGRDFALQRLHGMGGLLYDEARRQLPALPAPQVYAPVGAHRDLLPYLVRRLLENGANSSFVNRFLDARVSLHEVVRDPVADVTGWQSARNPFIPRPRALFGDERVNSRGIDLERPDEAAALFAEMEAFRETRWDAAATGEPIRNPARREDVVGLVRAASAAEVDAALARAAAAQPGWDATPSERRAEVLKNLGDLYERHRAELIALLVREAGKTVPDALAELREAVDFCRYYAAQCIARFDADGEALPGPTGESNVLRLRGRGVFACISPWNFPLAIFTGQVAAALAAGNAVVAKPAEQTPLVAWLAVRLLCQAGAPPAVAQWLPGPGETVGAALVRDARVAGVAFTGAMETARAINAALAARPGPIIPLIAETGGQNAMLVDSTALPEQVVDDVVRSAFGAAGQRCSALRVLYLQEDAAEAVLGMLFGAMDALSIGDPWRLATDVGPVIDAAAKRSLDAHAERLAAQRLHRVALPGTAAQGTFVAPQALAIDGIGCLDAEHFGPLLHVARFPAGAWQRCVDEIRASGFGLTLGIHSRIDGRVRDTIARSAAGNMYVNRDMVGAVVGTQPFGGEGESGTGPKAGGPNYLPRFAVERVTTINTAATGGNAALLGLPP